MKLLRIMFLVVIILFPILSHGCSHRILGVGEGQETFLIYKKPEVPPMDWHMCQVKFMCLTMKEYTHLRIYSIEMDGLVNKYARQINIINGNE